MRAKVRVVPMIAKRARQRPRYGLVAAHAIMGLIAIVLAGLTVAAAEQRLSGGASLSAIEAANLTADATANVSLAALRRR